MWFKIDVGDLIAFMMFLMKMSDVFLISLVLGAGVPAVGCVAPKIMLLGAGVPNLGAVLPIVWLGASFCAWIPIHGRQATFRFP